MFRLSLITFLILSSSVAANAGVLYEFSDSAAGLSFTVTLPATDWGYIQVGPEDGLICSPATCQDIVFLADASPLTHAPGQFLVWEFPSEQVTYFFAPGAFTTNGTHDSTSSPGAALTVTGAADVAVPEPATFGLLLAPLAAAFAFRRPPLM
jgi:hypothetical protein